MIQRSYFVIPVANYTAELKASTVESLKLSRKSLDGTLMILKWEGQKPPSVLSYEQKNGPVTSFAKEVLVLDTNTWGSISRPSLLKADTKPPL